jgi:large subunit ribosomal protein L24|tara:strand:+ start:187 stop:495 length:309 start_codon:yes stop_codon:yes gene_type:complete
MHVKKGMTVKVLSGNHKDAEGKVLNVFPKKQKLIIEGVNFRKRAARPTQENPSGGFVEREAPIHISNVMLVHNGEATRVGYKNLEDGSKVRISKKTNEEIGL